ncbi:MAG: glycoside hydrolase family 99-like domain-containing protein [Cyanobium sp. CZS 25K]|nr:glycoside hydrolase family 99-like domain-containing protein [Cyanobium sp. CZS25K]
MIKVNSTSRQPIFNPAIKYRQFSISSFDAPWYLRENKLAEVSPTKAWSHYRSIGQSGGLSARYEISKLVLVLVRERFGSDIATELRDLLARNEVSPAHFYPEQIAIYRPLHGTMPDPFYYFAELLWHELHQLNPYGTTLSLTKLLTPPNGESLKGNRLLLHFLISLQYASHSAIEAQLDCCRKGHLGSFQDLTPEEINAVERCFDEDFYLGVYADIRMSGVDPLTHFLSQGRLEGRQCTPIFDPLYYLCENPDIQAAKIDPFVHYIMLGWRERRNPSESFHHDWLERVFIEATKDDNGFCGYLSHGISPEQKLQIIHANYNSRENPDFRPRPTRTSKEHTPKEARVFAFYLTQYHPIALNDQAWGKGFTEWRNVTRAFPRYLGHYQPKLPADSTFYDLRVRQNIIDHVQLAKQNGVNGFCFYFYWFSGERVLEEPLNIFPEAEEGAAFPFCILWANENWTRKWDGLTNDVIIDQKYQEEDQLSFIRDVEPILLDPRYERVNGAPILIVYRPDDLPECKNWVQTWRSYWRQQGHGELHLVCVQFLPSTDPRDYGFDAMMQFPPNGFPNHGTHQKIACYTRSFTGNLYSYDEMQWRAMTQQYNHPIYRTSVPSWDNECRRPQQGDIFVGSTPDKFRDWTAANLISSAEDNTSKLCFVNAWNEWAESACLEPDSRYGYAHLESLLDARAISRAYAEADSWAATRNNAIVVHVFYLDCFEAITWRLKRYGDDCDLYITLPPLGCHEKIVSIREHFPNARFYICSNRGRDVLPFLSLIKTLKTKNVFYRNICKLHTKKSLHRIDGAAWLISLVETLLPAEGIEHVESLLSGDVGMLIPKGHCISLREFMGGNEALLNLILTAHGANKWRNNSSYFSSGTMFWIKGLILTNLADDELVYKFEYERQQVDGTLAHAWERAFTLLVQARGLRCVETDGTEAKTAGHGEYQFASLEGRINPASSQGRRYSNILKSLERGNNQSQNRVAILATFAKDVEDVTNISQLGAYLQKNGYFVVCINPGCKYDQELSDEILLDRLNCDLYLERRNSGYDFGSWAEGFFYLKDSGILNNERTQELLLINDSCILTDSNSDLITRARNINEDVVGLIDSHQFIHHIQSNFVLIRHFQRCDALLDSFFSEYNGRTLLSKDDVIQYGELELARRFKEMKIQWKPVFELKQLSSLTQEKYANKPAESWEGLTAGMLAEGNSLNPHHYMHEALYLDLGCPLIKKELVRDNPANYPEIWRYKQLIGAS